MGRDLIEKGYVQGVCQLVIELLNGMLCAVADPVSRYSSGASGQKTREASAMANTSLVRRMDTCTRPEEACGSVRAMPEHNTAVAVPSLLTGTRIPLRGNGATGEHRISLA